ncbi:hypothetical protein [Candidatus Skiveiella danica]|uniref:hypothetical protein n=1 Tax=Candidatus Skiveiella danica TaxID=3386177 RepID=UPI0039B988F9
MLKLRSVDCIAQVLTQDLGSGARQPRAAAGGNSIGMALAWLAVVKAGLVAVAPCCFRCAPVSWATSSEVAAHGGAVRRQAADELQLAQREHPVLQNYSPVQPRERTRFTGGACGTEGWLLYGLPHGGRRTSH